jgi:hypothetical protein
MVLDLRINAVFFAVMDFTGNSRRCTVIYGPLGAIPVSIQGINQKGYITDCSSYQYEISGRDQKHH